MHADQGLAPGDASAGLPAAPATLCVEVVAATGPHQVVRETLHLPAGSTVAQALAAGTVLGRLGLGAPGSAAGAGELPGLPDLGDWVVAVWGRLCQPGLALRDRDRVELLRGLRVDPKEARRQRYKGKRARSGVSGSPTR